MKKVAFLLLVLAFTSGAAFAADPQAGRGGVSFDLSGNYATEPASGFGGTFGPELGANVSLSRLGMNVSASKGVDVQGRASLAYYNWDESEFGVDVSFRRIPFFLGGRVVAPVSPQMKVYGQLGLEVSFDRAEVAVDIPGIGVIKDSASETHLGLTPGVGILFPVSNQFYVGANLSYHIIEDSYATLGVTVGFNLP